MNSLAPRPDEFERLLELLSPEASSFDPILRASEQERLLDLYALNILDSAPEAAFDEVVQQAAQLCGAPIALVSFIDEHRQWIKAQVGFGPAEMPREIAFCTYTIQEDNLVMIEDVGRHNSFRDNRLVRGEPHVRFYAGHAIRTAAGHNVGSLCVFDTVCRSLTAEQKTALALLAGQLGRELELRRARLEAEQLSQRLAQTESLLFEAEEVTKTGSWEFDLTTQQFLCTEHALNILHVPYAARSSSFFSLLPYIADTERDAFRQNWETAVAEGRPIAQSVRLAYSPAPVWVRIRATVAAEGSRPLKLFGTVQDITKFKQKELSLREELTRNRAALRARDNLLASVINELRKYPLPEAATAYGRWPAFLETITCLQAFESDTLPNETKPFGLRAVVEQVGREAHSAAQTADFRLEAAPELPPTAIGNAAHLRLIAGGLVQNMLASLPAGQVQLTADVVYESDREWILSFAVTGHGNLAGAVPSLTLLQQLNAGEPPSYADYSPPLLTLVAATKLIALHRGGFVFGATDEELRYECRLKFLKPDSKPGGAEYTDTAFVT